MRIIPTNKFLLKCGRGESALCDFCNVEIETIDHLFWQCIHVQTFWTEFSHFLTDLNIDIDFNLLNIAFGFTITIGKPEIMLKNFLIILGKYFIFRGKCLKIIPTLNQFKSFLRNRVKIEKEIYFMKDKLAQFEIMWGKFEHSPFKIIKRLAKKLIRKVAHFFFLFYYYYLCLIWYTVSWKINLPSLK